MRKALIETATGKVVNVIEIDPDDDGGYDHWPTPLGHELVNSEVAGLGDTWDGLRFTQRVRPAADDSLAIRKAELAAKAPADLTADEMKELIILLARGA